MARLGGRSAWIAWPAGLLCAAVVLALAVLAAPGLPGAVSLVGDTLRAASADAAAAAAAEAEQEDAPAQTCRDLYPRRLWSTLVWTPEALLSQVRTPPASTPEAVAAAAPTVVVTCRWRGMADTAIATTVSTVSPEGAAAVPATLSTQGFACATVGETVHCERSAGDVREVHDLRGDRWVSTTLTGWAPEGYAEVVASRAFGG